MKARQQKQKKRGRFVSAREEQERASKDRGEAGTNESSEERGGILTGAKDGHDEAPVDPVGGVPPRQVNVQPAQPLEQIFAHRAWAEIDRLRDGARGQRKRLDDVGWERRRRRTRPPRVASVRR